MTPDYAPSSRRFGRPGGTATTVRALSCSRGAGLDCEIRSGPREDGPLSRLGVGDLQRRSTHLQGEFAKLTVAWTEKQGLTRAEIDARTRESLDKLIKPPPMAYGVCGYIAGILWRAASARILVRLLKASAKALTTSAPTRRSTNVANADSRSGSLRHSTATTSSPSARAAASMSLVSS